MKNGFVLAILGVVESIRRKPAVQLTVLLCSLVFLLGGCGLFEQSGETAGKGHRRHLRNITLNQQSLSGDLDRALLFDQPSKLTPMRISPEIDD